MDTNYAYNKLVAALAQETYRGKNCLVGEKCGLEGFPAYDIYKNLVKVLQKRIEYILTSTIVNNKIVKIYLEYILYNLYSKRINNTFVASPWQIEHIWESWKEIRKGLPKLRFRSAWYIAFFDCCYNHYWTLFEEELEDFFDCFTGTFIKSKPTQD